MERPESAAMLVTKTSLVIGRAYVPPPKIVDMGMESERLQRALLARQRRWVTFEAFLDFLNEAIEPLLLFGIMLAIVAGVLKGMLP